MKLWWWPKFEWSHYNWCAEKTRNSASENFEISTHSSKAPNHLIPNMAMARASLHSFGHLPLPRSGPAWRSGIGSLQSGPSHFNAGPSQRTYATAARKRQEKWNAKTKEEQMEQYMNMMERVNMPGTMDLSNQRMEVLGTSLIYFLGQQVPQLLT